MTTEAIVPEVNAAKICRNGRPLDPSDPSGHQTWQLNINIHLLGFPAATFDSVISAREQVVGDHYDFRSATTHRSTRRKRGSGVYSQGSTDENQLFAVAVASVCPRMY